MLISFRCLPTDYFPRVPIKCLQQFTIYFGNKPTNTYMQTQGKNIILPPQAESGKNVKKVWKHAKRCWFSFVFNVLMLQILTLVYNNMNHSISVTISGWNSFKAHVWVELNDCNYFFRPEEASTFSTENSSESFSQTASDSVLTIKLKILSRSFFPNKVLFPHHFSCLLTS